MIDLAILGLLKEQDLHGYELKKRLTELLGSRSTVSFGSLYPALARLERNGAVKAVEAHTGSAGTGSGAGGLGAIPMTGALTGELAAFRARRPRPTRGRRGKKVYGITERGEQQLEALLLDSPGDDRTFALRVAFCRFLPPAQRLELFERRRAELAEAAAPHRSAPDGRLDRYRRALRDHLNSSTAAELAWLDRLIDAERADRSDDRSASSIPTGGTTE